MPSKTTHDSRDVEKRQEKMLVERMYELHQQEIVIGLTGRTGSGCSTTAEILCCNNIMNSRKKAEDVVNKLRKYKTTTSKELNSHKNSHIECLKKTIIENFLCKNISRFEFKTIKIRHIILLYAVAFYEVDDFLNSLQSRGNDNKDCNIMTGEGRCVEDMERIKSLYDEINKKGKKIISALRNGEEDVSLDINKLMYKTMVSFDEAIKRLDGKSISFSDVLQKWANSIRFNGCLDKINAKYDSKELDKFYGEQNTQKVGCRDCTKRKTGKINRTELASSSNDNPEIHPEELAKAASFIIKLLRKKKKKSKNTIYIIDSLRNPFEVIYLKSKMPSFYLFSINMKYDLRKARLMHDGLYDKAISEIDEEMEGGKKFLHSYTRIDISKCIEQSDVFIDFNLYSPELFSSYFSQLETFIALILHPGLIPPTEEERIMQVALAAKLNSGCLSRQVGAAVTNKQYSILSIGWNTVPSGQTPCSLRMIDQLNKLHKRDKPFDDSELNSYPNADYSKHELNNEVFKNAIAKLCNIYSSMREKGCINCSNGLGVSYCFKDVYNFSNKDVSKWKNQVHTRSLHAEENAFLQLAKHGSVGIKQGYLFTTASCCVLCAKKAYQLGIKKIFYVDSYPDISEEHILKSGRKAHWPQMELYRGAIGQTYTTLYSPLIPIKDEIEYMTGVSVKDALPNQDSKKEAKEESSDEKGAS